MKLCYWILLAVLAIGLVSTADNLCGAESKDGTKGEKVKPYPLKTCVVTGEKLGEMGKPYVFTHEGREIKLCCKGCLRAFNKEPAKYLKKLEEAEKKGKNEPKKAEK
jgi:hypothetical protein